MTVGNDVDRNAKVLGDSCRSCRAGWNLKINFGDLDINLLVQVVFLLFVRIQMIICMIPDDNNFKNRSENLLRFTICPGLSVQILYYLPGKEGLTIETNELIQFGSF